MGKVNPDNLFSIFDQDDTQIYHHHNLEDISSIPFVKLTMVVTGVDNYYTMDFLYNSRFKEHYQRVQENIKYKYYSKLYNYLMSVSLEDALSVLNIAKDYEINKADKAFQDLLTYFESIEEYEKCSGIIKYITLIQEKS